MTMQEPDDQATVAHAAPKMGHRIRTRRQKAQMTLQAVAHVAGISTGYLSLIERDKALPTLTTLDRIARALGTGLDHFVARPQPVDCVTRAASRVRSYLGSDQIGYERVSAQFPGAELSSYILTVAPGYESERVVHVGEEHVFILAGAMHLWLEDERIDLTEGDSVHYASERSHGWANPGNVSAKVLWTGTHDIFAERQIAPT